MNLVKKGTIISENENFTMSFINADIIEIKYHQGSTIELKEIKLIEDSYFQLDEPRPKKILQNLDQNVLMSPGARSYAAERSPELTAVAYIIKGLAHRLSLRFFTKMRKVDKKTEFFEDYQKGLTWLQNV